VTEQAGLARPGRKRSPESRQAILVAAMDLFGEVGYRGLTIEGIAARSGTGKQTIYRWWPSKGDVLLEAGAATADLYVPISDRGSYATELAEFLTASYRLVNQPDLAGVLKALMAEAQVDAEFAERFRTSFLQRRRDALQVIVDRARLRGDLPACPSPGTVADIVFGTIWYRVTLRDEALGPDLVAELVTLLGGGDATGAAGAGASGAAGPEGRVAGQPP
jgi:AcrR family transcriptional regulator